MATSGDLVTRQVQAEDDASFYVCRRFGRVDVLALLVLANRPRREREGLAALVADRNHQPLGEEVTPVAPHQAGFLRVAERALLGAQVLGKPAPCRRVTELEASGGLLGHSA